jgi:hypothetical protein
MTLRAPAAALCACLLLGACDPPREPVDLGQPGGDPRANPGAIRGVVRTQGGGFVPQVRVEVGDAVVVTDPRGYFEILGLPPGPARVRAARQGWSSTQREVTVTSGRATQVELTLLFMDTERIEVPEAGPEAVVTAGEVRVEFIDGAFTDASGAPVQGAIDVAVALVNAPETLPAAPGEMLASDGAGGRFPLESFGMVEVVLSSGGAPVTFVGNAQLSFPLAAGHGLADGEAIPLWSFDVAENAWIAEGEGLVDGGRFVAQVGHFTWWNADRPLLETACVTGILEMPSGEAASGFVVNATGIDHLGASVAVTGPDGSFCAPVKVGGLAELTTAGSDGAAIWTWSAVHQAGAGTSVCSLGGCEDLGRVALSDLTSDDDGDGVTELAGDCDDQDPTISPLAVDPSVDGVDSDCDGIDGPDIDGDGAADALVGGTDCDDGDSAVRPGRPELCNGKDDDCDGTIDGLSPTDGEPVFADVDGDGAGDPLDLLVACAPPPGYVDNADDCDDADPFVGPHADELCVHPTEGAGIDEDCDGAIDEDDAVDGLLFWADLDGDGDGNPGAPWTACALPPMASTNDTDCNDEAPSVQVGAVEVCNGLDDDCDTWVDEAGAVGEVAFYVDGDGDGYGLSGAIVLACAVPTGAAVLPGDCDDADPATNPGAVESCADTTDLNCDGSVQYADLDGDGAPACADCDDGDPSVGPNATELCDSTDSDCDGSLVDFFANLDGDAYPDCIDTDDDGDGDPDTSDCAPLDGAVFLGAPELCDGIDSDCDGSIVDSYLDSDGDQMPDCVDLDDDGDGADDGVDCAPLDPATFPGAPELCDGIDNDCDSVADPCSGSVSDAVVYGGISGGKLGAALGVGDLDGDGALDLAVGGPGGIGRVAVFSGPLVGALAQGGADASRTGESFGDEAGASLATGCDFDGDGQDDLAVGAWGHDQGGATAGAVYVLLGPVTGTASLATADAVFYGEASGDWAGWSVACAGDTDGDGRDGLLVGAWRQDEGTLDAGAAYLIEGSIAAGVSGSLAAADAKLLGESAFDYAGYSVAGAGDVDGDGLADVLIGAPGRDEAGSQAGAVYLVLGPISGTVSLAQADRKLLGVGAGDQAGALVAAAGDVDGDGLADVLVGAWASPGDNSDVGAAYVVHGPMPSTGSLSQADRLYAGLSAGDRLGESGATAGDVNGDGYADLLVGAPRRDAGLVDAGVAYLLLGGPSGLPLSLGDAAAVLTGEGQGDLAGSALSTAGDMDGDGGDDVVLGAPYADPGVADGGAAYLKLADSILP